MPGLRQRACRYAGMTAIDHRRHHHAGPPEGTSPPLQCEALREVAVEPAAVELALQGRNFTTLTLALKLSVKFSPCNQSSRGVHRRADVSRRRGAPTFCGVAGSWCGEILPRCRRDKPTGTPRRGSDDPADA